MANQEYEPIRDIYRHSCNQECFCKQVEIEGFMACTFCWVIVAQYNIIMQDSVAMYTLLRTSAYKLFVNNIK
jgi:hypothetical protein